MMMMRVVGMSNRWKYDNGHRSIGEHTFTIRGTEFSLDVKIKIELVD